MKNGNRRNLKNNVKYENLEIRKPQNLKCANEKCENVTTRNVKTRSCKNLKTSTAGYVCLVHDGAAAYLRFPLLASRLPPAMASLPLSCRRRVCVCRDHPVFMMYQLIALTAIFKSYPSYADAALYLSLLPLWMHTFSCESWRSSRNFAVVTNVFSIFFNHHPPPENLVYGVRKFELCQSFFEIFSQNNYVFEELLCKNRM